jgi:hypothetical protein
MPAKNKFARNDSGWVLTPDGRRIGITVLTQKFGEPEKVAIMWGGLYREYCLNPNQSKQPKPQSTEVRDSTLEYWQPKSGVIFLPIEGKGIPTNKSKESFFGRKNYPWVGTNNLDKSKPIQYIILTPKGSTTSEDLLDMVYKEPVFTELRTNTIIFVLWNERKNEMSIKSDLEDIKKYLKINKINDINPSDLKKIQSLSK